MTIAIAKKFGERIVVCSDTMISQRTGSSPDAIPGQLKAIVLNGKLSIAYAGLFERSLDTIRDIYAEHADDSDESTALEKLRNATNDGQCEFIVVSHYSDASIRKISNGDISDSLREAWIGSSLAAKRIGPRLCKECIDYRDFGSKEESEFTGGFIDAFLDRGTRLADGVGGVPVQLLASPYGHCYSGYAAVFAWDPIDLSVGSTPQQISDRKSGMTEWSMHGCAPVWRGVAIYGTYFEQPCTGYIYKPLEKDFAEKVPHISYQDFGNLIRDRAGKKRGAFSVD